MSKSKKSRCIFIISLCLGALVVGVVLFFVITGGRAVEEDGFVQNTRIYLTDFSWDKEEERLRFTLHNGTYQRISYGRFYYIETKKNGEWETATPRLYRVLTWADNQRAFSDQSLGRDFLAEEQLPGDYRVSVRYSMEGGTYYAVGYFTIPES